MLARDRIIDKHNKHHRTNDAITTWTTSSSALYGVLPGRTANKSILPEKPLILATCLFAPPRYTNTSQNYTPVHSKYYGKRLG